MLKLSLSFTILLKIPGLIMPINNLSILYLSDKFLFSLHNTVSSTSYSVDFIDYSGILNFVIIIMYVFAYDMHNYHRF